MTHERGDIVYASDPFKNSGAGRPWVVVNIPGMPFHGEQYVALALTSQTWPKARIPLDAADVMNGELPKESSILPWAVGSLDPADIQAG